jgi:hypothetical protein
MSTVIKFSEKKKTDKKFSPHLRKHRPLKKHPTKPSPGNVELNESTLYEEHDKAVINPNKVTGL